jgi:beta-galactosidase
MKLGVCYYPDHWPEERWSIDARLMREAGLSVVRIADFAWALIEPQEGEVAFGWLDRAIDALAAENLNIVLCTPTASPPPWLCRKSPEILLVDAQGRRRRHGSRRHYCPSSPIYRQHTERIVTAMASRYGRHPAVSGWQIDNEFGCHDSARCYCDACADAFRRWLEAKYRSVDALNDAWGTVFWSQIYNDWSEIDPPNLTIADPNPSHVLDYDRYSSNSFVTYQQIQVAALKRQISARQFVTTNYMSQFSELDYYELARSLDFITMSSYPTGHADAAPSLYLPSSVKPRFAYDVGDPHITSLGHTLMREYKPNRRFWVMEQQCGHVNWSKYNTGIRPGTVRLWTWHALASGADAVVYFRWRACLYGQEQLHSGLLSQDASPAMGYAELMKMAAERSLMSEIASQPHEAQIAILLDFDTLWALRLQPHRPGMDFMRHLFIYFRALQRLGLPVDIVASDADLNRYRLVILPTAYLATEQLAKSLTIFAESGGTVLLGVRSGWKTISNKFTDLPLPGLLRSLAGVSVSDWQSLPPDVSFDICSNIPGLVGPVSGWAEALTPYSSGSQSSDLEVLVQFSSGAYIQRAALVEHKVGTGRALYLGWFPDDPQAEALIAYLAGRAGVNSIAELPDGMIASRRGPYLILLNFTERMLMATVQGRDVMVGPRDVEVIKSL